MEEKPVYVSKEGLEKMKEELHYLKTTKTREVADRIERAKDLGDLSENAEYAEAKDEYAWTQGRILELEDAINRAQVIEAADSEQVSIGCRVGVEINGRKKEFTLVGTTEADPMQGRISNESPIGQALLGLKVGDEVEVNAPSGPIVYKVLTIDC
jgi:transcription elongation factor GreA